MIKRIWKKREVKGTVWSMAIMFALLLLVVVIGRITAPAVVNGGGGDPKVGDIHIDSANSFYDYSIGAWIIPGSDVGAASYRAELDGLQELNQTEEIIFNFLPDDILCHDSDRLAKGGLHKDRVIYIGQVSESRITRTEKMGSECPANIVHTIDVVLRTSDGEVASGSVNFCVGNCYSNPTTTPTVASVAVAPTATPTPRPTIVYAPPVPMEYVCSCAGEDEGIEVPEQWTVSPGDYTVCEDGHCITGPNNPIRVCGDLDEEGYILRWAGAHGDNAGITIPNVDYMMRHEYDGMPDEFVIAETQHGHTGSPVRVIYTKNDNKIRIFMGSMVIMIDRQHNVTEYYG